MSSVQPTTPVAASFESLLAPLLDKAFGVAYHLTRSRDDAQDLVQEAALQAFRAYHQFQQGTNFKAWYLRILTNCFFAQYRKKRRQPQTVQIEDAEPLYLNFRSHEAGLERPETDPAALVLGRIDAEQVARAIGDLPEEFRVVCSLYFVEDLAYQEIAEIVECPVGTVRSRLHRGRRMLQRTLWTVARDQGIIAAVAGKKPE